jgi:hypothetical protein
LPEDAFGVWNEYLRHKTESKKLLHDMPEVQKRMQTMMMYLLEKQSIEKQ